MLRYQVLPHPPPPAGRHFGLGQEEKNQNSFKLPHITRSNTVGQHPPIHTHYTGTAKLTVTNVLSYKHTHTQTHTHTTLKNNKEVGRRKLTMLQFFLFGCCSLRQRAVG
jgi:hypothetical protein